MEVNQTAVNGVPFATSKGSSLTSGTSLAETFDNFLVLLTTQLQHQDPLSPMDTTEFTNQLVSFTGVEQAVNTNKKLDDIISLQTSSQLNSAVSYIGNEVGSQNVVLMLQDGQADIQYQLAHNAEKANILIIDESGKTVRTLPADKSAGTHEVTWDGTDDSGAQLPDGVYGFLVSALDSNDQTVPLVQQFYGRVTGVNLAGGEVILNIGDVEVKLSEITGVRVPDTTVI